MLIHSSRRRSLSPLDVQLSGTHIQQVQNYKYLGVVISDTLSWSQHIDLVRSKAAKGIGLLHQLSWFLPRQALCTMYNAYILPHLTYADAVWGTCTQGQSKSLEHLQNYAACIILHRRVGASATDMRWELNWPTLASRRAVSEAVAVYQSVSGRGPAYLSALFQQCARTHQHVTRSASCRGICVPQVRTELRKKAFAVSMRASKSNDISSSIKSHLLTYSILRHLSFTYACTLLNHITCVRLHDNSSLYFKCLNLILLLLMHGLFNLYIYLFPHPHPHPHPSLFFYCLCLYCSGCLVK